MRAAAQYPLVLEIEGGLSASASVLTASLPEQVVGTRRDVRVRAKRHKRLDSSFSQDRTSGQKGRNVNLIYPQESARLNTNTINDSLSRPSREEAEAAVRTLLLWAGDDPDREGLCDTPKRVVKAYEEFFSGYHQDPEEVLRRTFEEIEGYDEIVALRDIRFESHCEHHMAPISGKAHVAYLPDQRVVGISKLARVVELYARRLQIQEKMTAQIANTINSVLRPKGVAVVIEATHQCITSRGVHKPGVTMVTSRMLGAFREESTTRREFLTLISPSNANITSL